MNEQNPAVQAAVSAASAELDLAESKAEEYALTHFFGVQRGQAYYAVLTGSATVQAAVTGQNIRAISWLEKLFLTFANKQLLAAFQKVGLA